MDGSASARANHAARMDGLYRYQRHIYDATRKFYLLGRDRLIAGMDVPPGGTVLEMACGTGRNLAAIGRAYPDARLFGVDISRQMLASARRSVDRAGLGPRTRLAAGDAAAFDAEAAFGRPAFDRVVISYALSMIPDWRGALSEAVRLAAPGGRVEIVDFGGQTGLPRWAAAANRRWLRAFHVTPRPGLAEAARATGGTVHEEMLYRDYAVLLRIVPPGTGAAA